MTSEIEKKKQIKKEYNYNYYHNIIKSDPEKYKQFIANKPEPEKTSEYKRTYYCKLKSDPEKYTKYLKSCNTAKNNENAKKRYQELKQDPIKYREYLDKIKTRRYNKINIDTII